MKTTVTTYGSMLKRFEWYDDDDDDDNDDDADDACQLVMGANKQSC